MQTNAIGALIMDKQRGGQMSGIESFLNAYGLAAIFVVLLVKSIGVPIPVPSDVIMLAAAARAAQGQFPLWQAILSLWLALVVGGIVQYELASGLGRAVLTRFGRYVGLTEARLQSAAAQIKRGGVLSIGVAIFTPGVRAAAVATCGVTGVPRQAFLAGLVFGSSVFLGIHVAIGYVGGALLAQLKSNLFSVPAVVGVVVLLLIVGLVAWIEIRRRRHPNAPYREVVAEAVEAWHEATCPVCLALGSAAPLH